MKLESPKPVVEQVVQNEDTQNVEQVSQPDTLVIEQVADEAMPVSEEDNDITDDLPCKTVITQPGTFIRLLNWTRCLSLKVPKTSKQAYKTIFFQKFLN